ncbi:MAG: hypothetical protein QM756_32545 [Polyangiaceae bacterium]
MKMRCGLLALPLACLFMNGVAWADDDDRPKREDPWEYDEAKAKARQKADKEENGGERSFGNAGELAISAERLVGVSRTASTTKVMGIKEKSSTNRVNLLLNHNGDSRGYSSPRLAFDYFAIDGLSLGASVGFSANSGDFKSREVLVAPRVGYALMFSETVGIWPRLGIVYQESKNARRPLQHVGRQRGSEPRNRTGQPRRHHDWPDVGRDARRQVQPRGPRGQERLHSRRARSADRPFDLLLSSARRARCTPGQPTGAVPALD